MSLPPPGKPAQRSGASARDKGRALQGNLDEQRLLAEQATELMRERGTEMGNGMVPVALGASLAARGRPEEAQPLIERAIGFLRRFKGEPTQVAAALLQHASVLRTLGERERSQAAIAEARSVLESCPDPGHRDRAAGRSREPAASALRLRRSGADVPGAQGAQAADQ